MRTDGQTDTTKLTVALRNFTNAPKTHSLLQIRIFTEKEKKLYITDRESEESPFGQNTYPKLQVSYCCELTLGSQARSKTDTLLTSEQYPYDQYHTLSFVRQKQRDGVGSSEHCPTVTTKAITRKVHRA